MSKSRAYRFQATPYPRKSTLKVHGDDKRMALVSILPRSFAVNDIFAVDRTRPFCSSFQNGGKLKFLPIGETRNNGSLE